MFSPKSSLNPPIPNKMLLFYQSSSQKHDPPPLIKSRLLTSQTHFRTHTHLLSPNRTVSKSIVIPTEERPLSTLKRKKHPYSGTDFIIMSDIKKNAKKLMVFKKEQKLMNFTENNNNSNQSITEERNLLSAYGNASIKTPYCEEENLNKIKRKHERILANRENIKKELVFNKFHEKITIDKDFQVFMTVLSGYHERNHEKFLLLPSAESETYSKFLDLESFILKLLTLFHQNFSILHEDFTVLSLKHQEIERNYSNLKMKNNDFLQKQVEKISEQNKKDFTRLKLNIDKYEIVSSLENIRLEKELNELQKGLESRLDVDDLNEEFQNFKTISQNQLLHKETKIKAKEALLNKYLYHLNTIKAALLKSEREIKTLQNENFRLKAEILTKNEEIAILREKNRSFREVCLMQREECDNYIEKNVRFMKTINFLSEKLQETKKKIGRNVENFGLIGNVEIFDKDVHVVSDLNGFMIQKFARILAKQNFSNDDFEIFQREKINPLTENQNPHKSSFGMSQSRLAEFEDVLSQIYLPTYQYLKPSFMNFVETTDAKNIKREDVGLENKISLHFLATVRGILDSKYNEFIFHNDYRSFSKFPEFVYSWLTTFEISEETKQIQEVGVEKSADPNEILLFFLKNLYHPLGLKLWECQNFKEFIEEKASIDELFFFLHCRFLLNKGPTLPKDGAAFCYVHYVLYYYAESIVDLVLKHFDDESKNFVKARLREKAKGKNKKLLIDVSFVLKVLLEYYRLERKQKFLNIRDLFRVLSVKKNNTVSKKSPFISDFGSFKVFLEKIYGKVTELEKAELYRECHQIGNGEITAEIAFSVLTESNFFINTLKLRSLMNMNANKTNLPKGMINKENYAKKLEFFNEKIKNDEKIQNCLLGVKRNIVELGLEKVCSLYDFNIRLLSEKYKFIDLAEFCGKSPELILGKIGDLVNKVRGLRVFFGHFNEEERIDEEWEGFARQIEIYELRYNDEKIKGFEKNAKIKRIQSFIKKRASKWYILMNNLLNRIKQKNP